MAATEQRYPDLREWLDQVKELEQLRRVDGADWQLEIGALSEMICLQSKSNPCLLFENIKDYPGSRLVTNTVATMERSALALNLPPEKSASQLASAWRERVKDLQMVPVNVVKDGPVLENQLRGKDIDVLRFPVPMWNEDDGGRYLGTADMIITRDPEAPHRVNVGTYRMMVQERDKLGLYIGPGQHGRLHRDRYFERGERMPVVAVLGMHPSLLVASALPLALNTNEYEWAGALQGKPVDVICGPVTGLPFPAGAEIVIEGFVDPEKKLSEGPFGEYTGYYASATRPETYVQIEAVYFRNDPIVTGSVMMRPPGEWYYIQNTIRQASIHDALQAAGVPDVRAVSHLRGSGLGMLVIAINQRYSGHAKQAAMIAAHTRAAGQFSRYIVVVDDDIDVHNDDEVLWALWTRADPQHSADLVRECWSQPLDPRLTPEQRNTHDYTHSRMIIDATRPFHWRSQFPKVVGTSEELKAKMREKWGAGFFA